MNDIKDLMRSALKPKEKEKPVFDAVDDSASLAGAGTYAEQDIKVKTASAIQQWAEADDLDDGETYADRLIALLVGIVDANKDGEVSDDEAMVLDVALNCAFDYLAQYGVDEEDAGLLLNDWDADAAERIRDLIAASLPEGEAADADIDAFAFGDNQEPMMDAVYKKTIAVRHGRKVKINKRISGTVRLSARQKLAIRKAQMKSGSAVAMARRLKSMRVRRKMGL
jgi:hypothetical protein